MVVTITNKKGTYEEIVDNPGDLLPRNLVYDLVKRSHLLQ